MAQNFDSFKHSTAELLVLYLLSQGDMYGYEITHAFAEGTNGRYTIAEGTLYPILYKLEDAGLISSYVVKVGVRRTRKFYRLEDGGRQRYEAMLKDYLYLTNDILLLLGKEGLPLEQ